MFVRIAWHSKPREGAVQMPRNVRRQTVRENDIPGLSQIQFGEMTRGLFD